MPLGRGSVARLKATREYRPAQLLKNLIITAVVTHNSIGGNLMPVSVLAGCRSHRETVSISVKEVDRFNINIDRVCRKLVAVKKTSMRGIVLSVSVLLRL